MKNRSKQIIISLLLILSLILITIGVSVSFFSYVREGSRENSIELGSITFKYTENENIGNGIAITDAFPINDEEGKSKEGEGNVFDFKVESSLSRSDLEYEVVAEEVEGSNLPLDAIKFYLTDITSGEEEEISFSLDSNGEVKTLADYSDTIIENASGKTVYQETILKNTKGYLKEFRVRMWINEDVDWSDEAYIGKQGAIRINVYANSDRNMAATEPTNPEDTGVERVVANQKYLFANVSNEEYQYTVTVPNEVETVDIAVIPTNTEATVEITQISRDFGLQVGENFFRAIVTSANKEKTQEYILRVVREESGNTDLASLGVEGYSLVPSYSDDNNLYEVEVPYETTSVEVVANKKEETQTITGLGRYELEVGTNVINVQVTAENGTTRVIQITVNRKLSNDASIANVGVAGYHLTHVENNIYSVNVLYEVEKITMENISTTGAVVEGIGEKELKVGNNDYEVKVTSASGEVTSNYIIRIVREKDTDNSLKSLSLTSCTLSPEFDSNTTNYTCTVENSVTATTVTAIANSSEASISGDGEHSLNVGENIITVTVTSQSGSVKVYRIVVTRKASGDASLKSLSVEGYKIEPEFDSTTTDYRLTVPYSVTNITVNASVNHSEASYEVIGNNDLKVGSNTVEVIVTAEDGTKNTYTITVTREKDTDNTLKSLNLTNCTLSPEFNSNITSYSCTVENSVTATTVTAIANSSEASISGDGEHSLNVGENTIHIEVTAQNESTKTYTIKVTRLPNSDASLNSLGVEGYEITPTFSKDILTYSLSVPYHIDSITIIGQATESVSNVEGLGSKVLSVGENSFDIQVTAEDKTTTRTYNITVTREKDTDASLKSIGVEGYTIVKENDNHYSLTVENNVTSVVINAEATSSVAIVTGTGKKDLKVGSNTFKVTVTSQSGLIEIYNVVITRKASSDATLKSLSVEGYAISPTFASNITSYTLSVPYATSSITVNASVNNSEASLTGTGKKSLIVGSNTVSVVVIAGDGTKKTYTITVTREKDTNNTLSSLSLTDCKLSPAFASGTTSYTCSVANSVTTTTVSATATSSVASVGGVGKKNLNVGDNTISVIVTAQNGSKKTYTVKVHRKSNDATLSSLSVEGYRITPDFTSETTSYSLTVPNAASSIIVNATKNHSGASVSGTGSKNLNVGNNTITIKVTAEDGNTQDYTIIVKRKGIDVITLNAKSATYTGSAIAANTATATSGSTITYTYYSSTNCSGTALSGSPTNVGNYSVKAVSSGNGDYESGSKCVTHTITKGTPKITLTAKTAEATGSAIPANAATAKNPNGTAVTLSYTYTYYSDSSCKSALSGAPSTVGTYYVKATSSATSNLNSASSGCVSHTITKNTNANLSALSVSGYSITPAFNPSTTNYTLTVEASSVTVNATAATSLSTVSGTGSKTLSWGSNTVSVIVTAQSGTIKTYKITITNQRPTAPVITGGSSNWVSTPPTIKVSTAGTAISGVKHYEYYKSTSNTAPSDSTTATGTTSGNLTVSDEGTTYIWYRTVSNNGFKSVWTAPQVTNLDTKIYTLTNLITNGSFENGLNNWIYSNVDIVGNGYHDNTCLRFNHNNGNDYTAMTIQELTVKSPTLNHKYYGSIMFKSSNTFGYGDVVDSRYEWIYRNPNGADETIIFAIKNSKVSSWTKLSAIQSITASTNLSNTWEIRNFQRGATEYSYSDALILVDLTETFGAGNEPDQSWCDENIIYFEDSITVTRNGMSMPIKSINAIRVNFDIDRIKVGDNLEYTFIVTSTTAPTVVDFNDIYVASTIEKLGSNRYKIYGNMTVTEEMLTGLPSRNYAYDQMRFFDISGITNYTIETAHVINQNHKYISN